MERRGELAPETIPRAPLDRTRERRLSASAYETTARGGAPRGQAARRRYRSREEETRRVAHGPRSGAHRAIHDPTHARRDRRAPRANRPSAGGTRLRPP